MKKIWLLLIVIVLGGCKMSSDTNEEEDGLYDYTLSTVINNERSCSYDFFYGTDPNSEDYVIIKQFDSYSFDRTIKVKDDVDGVPLIKEDNGPDCYLRIHEGNNQDYTIIKFSYKNVRHVTITSKGFILIQPLVVV